MKPYNENIEFKNIDDYLEHWDNFFKKWKKTQRQPLKRMYLEES